MEPEQVELKQSHKWGTNLGPGPGSLLRLQGHWSCQWFQIDVPLLPLACGEWGHHGCEIKSNQEFQPHSLFHPWDAMAGEGPQLFQACKLNPQSQSHEFETPHSPDKAYVNAIILPPERDLEKEALQQGKGLGKLKYVIRFWNHKGRYWHSNASTISSQPYFHLRHVQYDPEFVKKESPMRSLYKPTGKGMEPVLD